MAAFVAEDGDGEIGGAVHHDGVAGEFRGRGDEAAEADHLLDAAKITAAGGFQLGEQVDEADFGEFHGALLRDIDAHAAGRGDLAVDEGNLTGDNHQVAADDVAHVVGDGGGGGGERNAEFGEFGVDGGHIGWVPAWRFARVSGMGDGGTRGSTTERGVFGRCGGTDQFIRWPAPSFSLENLRCIARMHADELLA